MDKDILETVHESAKELYEEEVEVIDGVTMECNRRDIEDVALELLLWPEV